MALSSVILRQVQPIIALSDLNMPTVVKEQLNAIAEDLQVRTGASPVVALFVSSNPSYASAAAEALGHSLNRTVAHFDPVGKDAHPPTRQGVNLAQAVQTLDARQVVLFFDEADALFHKRTAVRDDDVKAETPGSSPTADGLPSFQGLSIVSARVAPEFRIPNLRYTVHLPDGPP